MEGIGIDIQLLLDDAEFDQNIDGLNKKILLLKKEVKALNKELKIDPKNIEDLQRKFKNLEAQEKLALRVVKEYEDTINEMQLSGKYSGEEMRNAIAGYEKAQAELVGIQKQLANCKEQLKDARNYTAKWGEALKGVANEVDEVADKFAPFSNVASRALQTVTKSAMEFETAFADVLKTVSVDEGQEYIYDEIRDGLRELAKEVPTTANELATIAGLAGQMNVPAQQIVEFTRAMVDFGNATNITATEATQEIAQIYNVIGKGGDYSSLDNLLSTIVDLGNNSATTERDIVEMFKNISSASTRVGMTEQQMVALATTLSSLGLDKGGASAISTIMQKIDMAVDTNADSLKDWADSAGVSVAQFKKLWQEDASGALVTLLTNLKKVSDEGGSINQVFDDLNIKELRRVDTLGRLINGSDLYVKALDRANKAYEEGTALTVEASKRYETLESQLAILKNNFIDFALSLGDLLLPYIKTLVDAIKDLADRINALDPQTKKVIARVLVIVASITPLLRIGARIISFIGTLIINIGTLWQNLGGLLDIMGGIVGKIAELILMNPTWVGAILAVIAVVVILYNKWDWFRNLVNSLIEKIKNLWEQFKQTNWIEKLGAKFGWLGEIIGGLIELVKTLLGWFSSLISKISEFLGLQSQVGAGIAGGALSLGGRGAFSSGGYGSGGLTLNANFNVTTSSVTRSDVRSWASWIADDINEELGRRI